jgi:mono/diheme cytochrome c family protein
MRRKIMQSKGFSWRMAGRMVGLLLLLAGLLGTVQAQFGGFFNGNKKDKPINVVAYPANVQKEYKVFEYKCSECHTTARALRRTQTPDLAKFWVLQMQAMPAADITDKQATEIIDFINYYQARAPKVGAASTAASTTQQPDMRAIAAGKDYFNSQDCTVCHTLSRTSSEGKVSLATVGSTLTREQILSTLHGDKASLGMPAVSPEPSPNELDNLVAYLQSLK